MEARVYLSNQKPPTDEMDFQLCGTVASLQNIEITCQSHDRYRYLAVILPKKEHLTICEVEAYIDGYFMNNISKIIIMYFIVTFNFNRLQTL